MAHRAATLQFANDPDNVHANDYAYDPRVCKIEDTYYITWCGGHNGPTISVASTPDFEQFTLMENAFLPFNRNGVLFPRKINGKYFMLSRPSDDGHTPFGNIYVSQSPDMIHWGKHRLVMKRGGDETGQWWQRTKIGAGPIPIETEEGWLMIYHGVMDTCNGFVYSMGAAILDLGIRRRCFTARINIYLRLRPITKSRPRAERRVPLCGAVQSRARQARDLLWCGGHGFVVWRSRT